MDFAQKSDAIPSLEVPADAIRVDKQTIPDIDFDSSSVGLAEQVGVDREPRSLAVRSWHQLPLLISNRRG
jgi:hypothetical protein